MKIITEKAYYTFSFFKDLALIYPVYLILFKQSGLDFVQISILLAVWAAAMFVAEIPSGILSDIWSRKGTIFIALLFKGAGFVVWIIWPSFYGYLAGFVLWGVQEALCSGTTNAMLYDALTIENKESQFAKILGRGHFASRLGIILSVLLGGLVFSRSVTITLVCSTFSMIMAAVCVLFIKERRTIYTHDNSNTSEIRNLLNTVISSFKIYGLYRYIFFGSFITVVYGILDEYDFVLAREYNVPVSMIGLWGAVRFGSEGLGALAAEKINFIFGFDNHAKMAGWAVAGGVLVILGTLTGVKSLLIAYFVFFFFMASFDVLYHAGLQQKIDTIGRATISSVASAIYTGIGILLGIGFGFVADFVGLRFLFVAGGSSIVICASVWVIVLKLQKNKQTL
ncbi:MAG: hypothetical protein JXK07_16970 [Spirochaetes bacterium]|nr:hypothetical protein [Spirochaetota bacterium]MBN2772565.1 hypothetical protein [Spirochaetota bacterium]